MALLVLIDGRGAITVWGRAPRLWRFDALYGAKGRSRLIEPAVYFAFVRRAGTDPIARRVELADIEDNMDVRRLEKLDDRAVKRMQKYFEARPILLKALA